MASWRKATSLNLLVMAFAIVEIDITNLEKISFIKYFGNITQYLSLTRNLSNMSILLPTILFIRLKLSNMWISFQLSGLFAFSLQIRGSSSTLNFDALSI